MSNIEIQAHADCVRGDEIVNLAAFVHGDLGIAGARGQRAHDHRCSTLLTPNQFRDRVHVLDREPDDRGSMRQSADLLRARVGEGRKSLAALEAHLGHERRDGIAHCVGSHEDGFHQAPGPEQPIREDMPALRVGGELDFVDGKEIDRHVPWHRFRRANPVLGSARDDSFLTGQEGHHRGPAKVDNLVVDLAGEQSERQADDPRPVGQHPLYSIMCLSGIRGTEGRRDAALHLWHGRAGQECLSRCLKRIAIDVASPCARSNLPC